MEILITLVIGLVVGALAKLLMPGPDPGGLLATILLGIAGSVLAGYLGKGLGWYSSVGQGPGIIAAVLGAMLLLVLYRLLVRPRPLRRL